MRHGPAHANSTYSCYFTGNDIKGPFPTGGFFSDTEDGMPLTSPQSVIPQQNKHNQVSHSPISKVSLLKNSELTSFLQLSLETEKQNESMLSTAEGVNALLFAL